MTLIKKGILLSKRIKILKPSPTLALDSKVKDLQQKGTPVINLGIGEPDFKTPENICKAARKAIADGFTHYTVTAGILPLRQEITKKLLKENNLAYSPQEIVVGVGSKQLLYNTFLSLLNKGDEVLIPIPTWSTYVEQIKLAGARPVLIPLSSPFKLTGKDIKNHISHKTKIILLNSPSNPTGAIIDREELKKIGRLAVKKNLWIVSDEIYEKLIYDNQKYISIASLGEDIKQQTITINGFSKSYAMTGWRIGYACGPKEIIEAIVSLQSQTTSNTSSIAQMAALEALIGSQKSVENMRKEFEKRRNIIFKSLSQIKEVSIVSPSGAFYFFISIKNLLNKKYPTSQKWAEGLLSQEKVAVIPGEAFLYPGYIRLSFAASIDNLQKGLEGIKKLTGKTL